MAEYIEKRLAKIAIRDLPAELDALAVQRSIEAVGRVPAADVAPVVHGRWIHTDSHLWYKTDDGSIDEWRLDVDYHNGPECQVCGYAPCMHCHPDYMEDKCSVGHYECSECSEPSVDGHEKFCPGCGAKMDLE